MRCYKSDVEYERYFIIIPGLPVVLYMMIASDNCPLTNNNDECSYNFQVHLIYLLLTVSSLVQLTCYHLIIPAGGWGLIIGFVLVVLSVHKRC